MGISSFAKSPKIKKFLVLAVYALLGAAAQAGLIPEVVVKFLADNVVEFMAVAAGVGHVLPEAGRGQG